MEFDKKGIVEEDGGILTLDTNIWKRPTSACDYLEERGVKVSRSLMNYWKNSGKIKSKTLDCLGGLTLVNIETVPDDMRVKQKIQ